ncbi:MAG: zinc ribbon domain-containing protein, partial [Clostridia bacterium]|nr:zinc ribbon domain-containing protein [Clostridia bacterium]
MAEDFFDSLKQTITDTAEVVGKKTEDLVEIQKLRSRIRGAQRVIAQDYSKIGALIYQRFVDGEVVDEEVAVICEEIMESQNQVAGYKEKLAGRKGQNICPICGSLNPKSAAFCMQCGAQMPKEEPKEDDIFAAGPVSEDEQAEEAEQEVWDACTEEAEESADQDAEDEVQDVKADME